MNRVLVRAATFASILLLAALSSASAFGATISRSVTLKDGASHLTVALPAVSGSTVYSVTVTSPKKPGVTVDLRGKAGSIKYPGIFTTTKGSNQLRVYTYPPLEAGKYRVVVGKAGGSTVKVKLQVTSKAVKSGKS
jgi:hypothetical protein